LGGYYGLRGSYSYFPTGVAIHYDDLCWCCYSYFGLLIVIILAAGLVFWLLNYGGIVVLAAVLGWFDGVAVV